jgi:hypothetical protein
MIVKLTYWTGSEAVTVEGTPSDATGNFFVLRKSEGGFLKISKRLILKIEEPGKLNLGGWDSIRRNQTNGKWD